ncbi:MAG: O-acetyl-ADP-ribose deacetylase [Chitinophagales bacterium]|nr:O-acetyl-ADP-ribose deacetylase [Chitinophagales bacterium]
MESRIDVIRADITKIKADAIVNAANSALMGGGGVDGAIHAAGGRKILEECMAYVAANGRLPVGEAMITSGGMLPAKYVIHTVGPVWSGGNNKEDDLLKNAYLNSLKIASAKGIRSIVFPNISTGIFHFPKDRAAAIAVDTTKEFLKTNSSIERILFVCYDEENYQLYQSKITTE